MTMVGALARPGDALRQWWSGAPRAMQWLLGLFGFGLLALLPVWRIPLLDTPHTDFRWVMAQFSVVALIAVGLNVVVGQAGLLDLGYVGFCAIGAYTVALITSPASPWNRMGTSELFTSRWAWLSSVPIAIAVAALFALLLCGPALRLRGQYLAFITLGFGELIRLVAQNLSATKGARGLGQIAYPHLGANVGSGGVFSSSNTKGNLTNGVWWFWLGLIVIALLLVFVGNLERSRVGRSWAAIRADEDTAELMGVPVFRFKLWAFVIGACIGGLSGALYAGQAQQVAPTFGTIDSMLFLSAVILGGRGNNLGVVVGAFVVVYLPQRLLGVEVAGVQLSELKYFFFALALVIVVLLRPQGLFPAHRRLLAYWRKVARRRTPLAQPNAEPELEAAS